MLREKEFPWLPSDGHTKVLLAMLEEEYEK